jgi:hypothetical protein
MALCLATAACASGAGGSTYYVTTNGSDSNDGTSEATPWRTLAYAAANVIAGDTVHIKAGDYGNEVVVFGHSGTSNAPIRFEGYRISPGDVSSPAYFDLHQAGGPPPPVLSSSAMPLFNGRLDLSARAYVEARHFQINGGAGVYMSGGDHVVIDNYLSDGCDRAVEVYQATAVTLLNCQVKNAATYPFHIRGSSQVWIENCTSRGVTTDADYHFIIEGYDGLNVQGNTIRHCYAEGDADGVHGIGIKAETCFGNTIEDCVARNFSNNFYVRHHNVYSNTFRSCTAYGGVNGFVARDGAHANRFIACATMGSPMAFTCYDSSEDKTEGSNQGKNTFSAEGNVFTNCTFQNASQYAIRFDDVAHDSPAANNSFDHCTFDGGGTLILHQTSNNYSNRIHNSVIRGYGACEAYDGGSGQFAFAQNTCWNNGFPDSACDCGTAPQPVQLLNPQRLGANFQFQFLSQAGTVNTVQSRTNSLLGSWQDRTNLAGDGTSKTVTLPILNGSLEFLRVMTQ